MSLRAPENARADPAFWLLIGQLIMFTGVAAVFPIAPLYVAHRGGNSIAVAIFIAGPLVSNTLVQVPAGRLCDRWGRKPFLIGPRLVYAFLSLFLFFNIGTLPVLTAIRILMGACAGAYVPALAGRAHRPQRSRRSERSVSRSSRRTRWSGLLVGPLVGGACSAVARLGGVRGHRARDVHRPRSDASGARDARPADHARLSPRSASAGGGFAASSCRSLRCSRSAPSGRCTTWSGRSTSRRAVRSPLIIGLSVSLFALPILVLARAGGRLADRADRRKLVTAGTRRRCARARRPIRSSRSWR